MQNLPLYIPVVFVLTTLATILFFHRAVKKSADETLRKIANKVLYGIIAWLCLQAVITVKGIYYSDTTAIPPRIMLLGILPAIIMILCLFATQKGRRFIDGLPLANLTYLNVIRVPVELVLWWLFLCKAVPQLMTFEGRNFDIIAGITAPFIACFGLIKKQLSKRIILVWNIACLALLLNIVINALLSAPSPLQRFAFGQPNIAILYFPFSWLPTAIVPLVLFGHLASLRILIKQK